MYIAGISRTLGVLLTCCLLLAACGGSDPSAATNAETGAAVADEETPAPPQVTEEASQADGDAETGFEEVMSAIEGLDGQERIDELSRLAQDEGVVQIYS